jgi:hypothetical protein
MLHDHVSCFLGFIYYEWAKKIKQYVSITFDYNKNKPIDCGECPTKSLETKMALNKT